METKKFEPNREKILELDSFGQGFRAGIQQSASTVMLASDRLKKQLDRLGVDTAEETLQMLFAALEQSALQLTRTAENLDDLFLSRQNALRPKAVPVEISQQLEKIVEMCKRTPAAQGVQLHFETALPEGEVVCTDPQLLTKTLLNLLSNAMRTADQVQVRLDRQEQQVVLTVEDNGSGISQSIREHLFEPFVTDYLPALQTRCGLGLFLVRAYCHAMDWELRLEDREPGTRAVVSIPEKNQQADGLGSCSQSLALEQDLLHSVELEMSALEL